MSLDSQDTIEINVKELDKITAFIRETSMGMAPNTIKKSEIKNVKLKEIYGYMELLYDYIVQMSNYSLAISHGDLSVDFPSRDNYLSAGLKELHSNMLHLTWKVQQVSQGKFNQKIDALGEISDAFNKMLDCLKTRDIEIYQLREIVKILFLHSNIMIFVINSESGKLIYQQIEDKKKRTDVDFKLMNTEIIEKLKEKTQDNIGESFEWEMYYDTAGAWFSINSLFTTWVNNEKVYFHMLMDISNQKEKIDTLQEQVARDPMTLVYNQGFAMEKVTKLLHIENKFSICFMDIDGLKTANDVYGHDVGDKLIMSFVSIINYVTRGGDYFCRLGGDEFLLISINTSYELMDNILERVQINMDAFNELEIIPVQMSFSYGIESFDKKLHESAKTMISMADQKMYVQKRRKYSEKKLVRQEGK